jgi:hypothetical protein
MAVKNIKTVSVKTTIAQQIKIPKNFVVINAQ